MDYMSFGFYKCTVSKCILTISTMLFLTLHVVLRKPMYFQLFDYDINRIINNYEIWRLITAKIVFKNPHDWLIGNYILFSFKFYEKRCGSQKYISCIFALWILTSISEIVFATLTGTETLPSGPCWLIFSHTVFFFYCIPKIELSQFGPINFTQKTIHYVLLANILVSGGYFSIGIIGVVAGLAYQHNFLHIKQWLVVPRVLQKPLAYTFGRLVASNPPNIPDLMGATLEIQRRMQSDALEQRMIEAQLGLHRTNMTAIDNAQQIRTGLNEEAVTVLTSMGFQREAAINALREANNNVQTATTMLLR